MGDAAQYGVQRFIPKVVVPFAPLTFHVDQRVLVSTVFASAQETTSVRGRTTDDPEQVITFTDVFDATDTGPLEDGNDEPA